MAKKETPSPLHRGQFNIFRDVELTLGNIIKREILQDVGIDVQVLIELPSEDELPSVLPSVAVCLYHLGKRDNGYVQDPEFREVEEAEDGTLREFSRLPPLFLDLRFVITVYAESHKDELSLLGLAMRALYDTDVIEKGKEIGDSIYLEDRPGIEVGTASYSEMRAIWESYQLPYRPSFTANVEGRLDSKRKRLIRRVREAIVDFKKMDG